MLEVNETDYSSYHMEGEQRVYFHYCKVVPEKNECRDVNDVLRAVPEMGEELARSRGREPDKVAQDDIPNNTRSQVHEKS